MGWNPLSLVSVFRHVKISRTFEKYGLVLMAGTGVRAVEAAVTEGGRSIKQLLGDHFLAPMNTFYDGRSTDWGSSGTTTRTRPLYTSPSPLD